MFRPTLFIALLLSFLLTSGTILSQENINYPSLYQLHLQWNIEDFMKQEKKLEINREKIISPEEKISQLKEENSNIAHQIDGLKKEQLFSYQLSSHFQKTFQAPQRYRGTFIFAGIELTFREIGRVLLAYGLLPISVPFTIFGASKEWFNKLKENNDKITFLEEKMDQNNITIESINSDIENLRKAFEIESAKIDAEIMHIKTKINELEIEKKELKHFDNFKKNFKFKYR